LYFGASNKFNYILHDYAEEFYENFSDYLRKRFWSEKLKSTEKKPTGFLNTQEGERLRKVRSSKIDEQFFIFSREVEQMEDGTKEVYFGKIIFNCDYEGLEERDMEKPVRRSELAISPRISKIMINLSEVKKGPLLDSFCGVGVILFEALLQNLSVVGVDIDKSAIGGAKENLAWGKFDRKKYSLIANDSKKVKIDSVEVLLLNQILEAHLEKF
jgi:tRNA G10  N-methylase Trm11